MLPSTRKACGFTTLNDVNGKEYVPEFYTNDIENVNSQIKFWVNEKLPLDVFIQKMKDLIECQERQYIDAISGTGDFEFAEKFKYLEIGSAWSYLDPFFDISFCCMNVTIEIFMKTSVAEECHCVFKRKRG